MVGRDALVASANRLLGCVRRIAAFQAVDDGTPLVDDGARAGLDVRLRPAAPGWVALVTRQFGLPRVVSDFFLFAQSDAFGDTGLSWRGVSCWISTAESMENPHIAYAGQDNWPEHWIVIAIEYEGCYFVDTSEAKDGDVPVYYLEHCRGHDRDLAAPTFVEFLEAVADSSLRGAGERERAISRGDVDALHLALRDHATRGTAPAPETKPAPLSLVVLHGREHMIDVVLDAGADPLEEDPVFGVTPLGLAMLTDQPAMVRRMALRPPLRRVDFETLGLAAWAARHGLLDVVQRAVRAGVLPATLLEAATEHEPVLRWLFEAGDSTQDPGPLFARAAEAHARRGEVRALDAVLAGGRASLAAGEAARLRADALAAAAEKGDADELEAALGHRTTGAMYRDAALAAEPDGIEAALARAAAAGQPSAIERLLAARSAESLPARGGAAVREAARRGFLDLVEKLLASDAAPDEPDEQGATALMLAALKCHTATVSLLLDRGASADRRDREGRNAHAYALRGLDHESAELLVKAGAEPMPWITPPAAQAPGASTHPAAPRDAEKPLLRDPSCMGCIAITVLTALALLLGWILGWAGC